VTNLRKFTKYEFFLMPFYRSIEGQPSNSMQVSTEKEINVSFKINIGTQNKKHRYIHRKYKQVQWL
jgi:roundabout axon guidance receptor 2